MDKIAKRQRIGRATGTAVQRLAACEAVRNAAQVSAKWPIPAL